MSCVTDRMKTTTNRDLIICAKMLLEIIEQKPNTFANYEEEEFVKETIKESNYE